MERITKLIDSYRYNQEYLVHCLNSESHLIAKEDLRLKSVVLQNYLKSFMIGNIFAKYFNYIRKNKSYKKTLVSKRL